MMRPVALITGGTGGVGSGVCRHLADRGYDIAFAYRSEEKAAGVREDLRERGAEVLSASPDLTDPVAMEEFVAAVLERFGRIDAVVHAAGPYVPQRFVSRVDSGTFRSHIEQELFAFVELVRVCLPPLRETSGSLTAVTTMALRRYPARDALSSVPKGGIEALIHAVAVEEGRFGVRANAVGPGVLEDGMGVPLAETGDVPPDMRERVIEQVPLGRLGSGSEVASVVAFLASADAAYVTGQVVDVDGGWSL